MMSLHSKRNLMKTEPQTMMGGVSRHLLGVQENREWSNKKDAGQLWESTGCGAREHLHRYYPEDLAIDDGSLNLEKMCPPGVLWLTLNVLPGKSAL